MADGTIVDGDHQSYAISLYPCSHDTRRPHAGRQDLPYRVGRLVLRFVVGARLHLGEQPDGHQLDAGEHQHDPEQQQRLMLVEATGCPSGAEGEPAGQREPGKPHGPADQAEDVERPRRVAQQKLDRQQVEHDPDGAADPVARSPVLAADDD